MSPSKGLVAGWFSFEDGHATAGDLLARDVVCEWLDSAGVAYDIAVARPFTGGVDWEQVDPQDYSHVIFVCGPFTDGPLEAMFLARFAECQLIGIDLTMLIPLQQWQPFDTLFERDSSVRANPDIVFASRQPRVPVVGVCLVEPYAGAVDAMANAAITRLIASREMAVVMIDTRLDTNTTGLRSPAEVESLLARMDMVITTRLHGMVLALKNSVPVIAIDPEAGGAKIRRQAETIGWPVVFNADALTDDGLQAAFDYCLTDTARRQARECTEGAMQRIQQMRDEFITLLTASPNKQLDNRLGQRASDRNVPFRPAVIETVEVAPFAANAEQLWGANIDLPQPGARSEHFILDIAGWVVGRETPAVAVELVNAGVVFQRVPLNVKRTDIAALYMSAPNARYSGFYTSVNLLGITEFGMVVQAVLQDGTRIPFSILRVRRQFTALPAATATVAHVNDSVLKVGTVNFGDLRRVEPVSRAWGYDRGLPVDRYYIENFLALHADDVHGRVLEIGDDAYTRQFGGERVVVSDVLHVAAGNPKATIIGDLAQADHIPSNTFDCIILTQTLHLIYDLSAAVASLFRILKPGGVLLATFPGISHIDHGEWNTTWYWSFTTRSAWRLFTAAFPEPYINLESHGNVLSATAFLQGLAREELRQDELDHHDPHYELLITVRAVKPKAEQTPTLTALTVSPETAGSSSADITSLQTERENTLRGPTVEILDVVLSPLDQQHLRGGFIDMPQAGVQTEARAIDIAGWVVGHTVPAVAVEVIYDKHVIRHMPLHVPRTDVAAFYSDIAWAEKSGFQTTVSIAATAEFELQVQTVLQNQQRIPLGLIRGRGRRRDDTASLEDPRVSIIIPCYNQGHFLGEAIESALSQTYPHVEIVVIDDGSTDNTQEIATRYPGVRYIRQANQGLSGARNTGLQRSAGTFLVFLDADDRLLPHAVQTGLDSLKAHPECAFTSGWFRFIALGGSPLSGAAGHRVTDDHYLAMLRQNYIAMHATVMYRREVFQVVKGFDTSLRACEDYDLYLRIARDFPVCSHDTVVAEYRRHSGNMTRDSALMLRYALKTLRAQWPYVKSSQTRRLAYQSGIRFWTGFYGPPFVEQMTTHLREGKWSKALQDLLVLVRYYPQGLTSLLLSRRP